MSDRLKMLGGDAPLASEDRAPGFLRGAGARSPLFWKLMLVVMALMWGYPFFIMKDTLDSIPTFMLLACRFLISAAVLFVLFMKRIRVHFNRRNIVVGCAMGVFLGLAYAFQAFGLAETTAGKNAFLTGTYCILVPFVSYLMAREPLTRFNVGAAALCVAGIALVGTILFLALCCTCLGMLMQNLGLAHVPSSTGSLLLSLESPSGVLFSVLFAGEQLTMRLVAGFALIFTSIVLSETHFSFLLKPYAHVRKRRER